mgnify:CR=1 FL=1
MTIIEFDGELTEENKNFLYKQEYKLGVVVWITVFISSLFLLFIDLKTMLPFVIAMAVIVVFNLVYPKFDIPKKEMEKYYPLKISIDNERITWENTSFDSYCSKEFRDIKRVFDYGNFYYITFHCLYLPAFSESAFSLNFSFAR